ncbi:hypothetical protein B7C51_25175 (plasmid) [Paenibacillus larvae subsp. pulvifaciens]|uniref:Uncharacterized protein n=1 Tax=Paenibacillus larvae subsp. pulvifaciens TaxID=1477 RepID=A0A1V0UZW6_9BACL|nr:hypothetical protein [Paenibacillus larvae]ARF70765.1 hypothetical protein B7C51_25175 [Paenibacillus larvae subsp. pulvifaciens]
MKKKIPINFEVVKSVDDRFVKVKIRLMHLGKNYNGSYFDKESVKKAIPSLANTPILGFIENIDENNEDYSDHRIVIIRKNGKLETKYLGQAYGVIPEDNNARFEDIIGSDGIVRTYLVCDGLMWTKFEDATRLVLKSKFRNQSIELHTDYKGYYEKDNYFHFTDFKFYGACIIGDDVAPAMTDARIETVFSKNELHQYINIMLEDFKSTITKNKCGGEMMKEKLKELLKKYSVTKNDLTFDVESVKNEEELESKISEVAKNKIKDSNTNENDEDNEISELKKQIESLNNIIKEKNSEFTKLHKEYISINEKYDACESELIELRSFKDITLKKQRDKAENELYNKFISKLSEDEMRQVKENAKSMSIEEIEKELFALYGRKNANFSKRIEDDDMVRISVHNREKNYENEYEYLIKKHIKD